MKVARTVLNGESGSNAADLHNKEEGFKDEDAEASYDQPPGKNIIQRVRFTENMNLHSNIHRIIKCDFS